MLWWWEKIYFKFDPPVACSYVWPWSFECPLGFLTAGLDLSKANDRAWNAYFTWKIIHLLQGCTSIHAGSRANRLLNWFRCPFYCSDSNACTCDVGFPLWTIRIIIVCFGSVPRFRNVPNKSERVYFFNACACVWVWSPGSDGGANH